MKSTGATIVQPSIMSKTSDGRASDHPWLNIASYSESCAAERNTVEVMTPMLTHQAWHSFWYSILHHLDEDHLMSDEGMDTAWCGVERLHNRTGCLVLHDVHVVHDNSRTIEKYATKQGNTATSIRNGGAITYLAHKFPNVFSAANAALSQRCFPSPVAVRRR